VIVDIDPLLTLHDDRKVFVALSSTMQAYLSETLYVSALIAAPGSFVGRFAQRG
jgi:hypothetical protein